MSEKPHPIAEDDPEWCAGCGQKHSKCECASHGDACMCDHDRDYHGNADGQTGWQAHCGHPDCGCDDFEVAS